MEKNNPHPANPYKINRNIPHISIEKITSRKDVSIRGRKIVADFVNDRARLEIDRETSAGDLVQNI